MVDLGQAEFWLGDEHAHLIHLAEHRRVLGALCGATVLPV
jgi:hypothetical protein